MLKQILFGAVAITCASTAFADGHMTATNQAEKKDSNWSYSIGAGMRVSTEYLGSDTLSTKALPVGSATYTFNPHHKVSIGIPETGYTYKNGAFKTGIKLGYNTGRDSEDDRLLTGLEDIDAYTIASPFISYKVGEAFTATVQPNIPLSSDVDGYNVDISANKMYTLNNHLKLGWKAGLTYADKNYIDSNFSVTENASVGRAAYTADDAGIYSYNASITGLYMFNRQHAIRADIGAKFLNGNAADSSITQEETQPFLTIGYGYRF